MLLNVKSPRFSGEPLPIDPQQVLQLWLGRRDLRETSAASKQRPTGKVWVGTPKGKAGGQCLEDHPTNHNWLVNGVSSPTYK